ncbi:MAG: hypothetical protein RQ760_08885, partial [Sedimentisphaerales bacterium]|nr:hypothetical protein [Sedimentisphaerales bacterium]
CANVILQARPIRLRYASLRVTVRELVDWLIGKQERQKHGAAPTFRMIIKMKIAVPDPRQKNR